jgi:D-tyrosyl-tRNA(Tyr) deacylase
MRAVVQRVGSASVCVGAETVGAIDRGVVVLLGVANGDSPAQADWLAEKLAGLRIFSDADGKFAHSLLEVGGAALVVSQFTLLADTRKGRRPSFTDAAPPLLAEALYRHFVARLAALGIAVATGRFGASMQVSLINDGPVTIILDSPAPGQPGLFMNVRE